MPEHHSDDDAKWIQEMLMRLPTSARNSAAAKYSEVYETAFNDEPVSFKQENKARHEANTRLRAYVAKYNSVVNCEVCEPPVLRAA